jgi:hypothetical protein
MRRSNNVKKLKMSMQELLEIDKKENPDKYASEEEKLKKIEDDIKNNKKPVKQERPKEDLIQAV